MAITDKETGVWSLDQVYNKINQGSIWEYTGANQLMATGYDDNGQIGLNSRGVAYSSPVQIPGTTWKYVSGSGTLNDSKNAFYIKTDGTMWGTGTNSKGQLGLNDRTNRSSPTQIPGTTWGPEVETLGQKSYAIKTDGTLWAWGYNNPSYGELGHNNKTDYSSPVQIPGTTWSKVVSYGYGAMTTKTDGTLWTWGANNFGMLGLNNTTAYSSPKQVPGSTWGTSIGGGNQFGAAVKTDGTLWMWGVNEYGMLGQNDKTNYSSPRQVPGTTWSKVSGMQHNVIAVKTDGTAWSWGLNDGGQLGLNDLIYRSSPTQIPGTTWNNITTSQYNTLAVKTDGTLWGWGNNGQGQLGQNAVNNNGLSSPVQIPGTGWNTGDREFGTTWLGFRATKIL